MVYYRNLWQAGIFEELLVSGGAMTLGLSCRQRDLANCTESHGTTLEHPDACRPRVTHANVVRIRDFALGSQIDPFPEMEFQNRKHLLL